MSCVCGFSFFFFKQKTAYEMRISDWSSDVCSSDLLAAAERRLPKELHRRARSLAEDGNDAFALCARPGSRPGVTWRGPRGARLVRGSDLLIPKVAVDRSLGTLHPDPGAEERRVGKEGVGTCGPRGSTVN